MFYALNWMTCRCTVIINKTLNQWRIGALLNALVGLYAQQVDAKTGTALLNALNDAGECWLWHEWWLIGTNEWSAVFFLRSFDSFMQPVHWLAHVVNVFKLVGTRYTTMVQYYSIVSSISSIIYNGICSSISACTASNSERAYHSAPTYYYGGR